MVNNGNGSVWPGWETVRVIGRGSFGVVYEIQRDVFGHTEKAALKVISIPQSEKDIDELINDGYDEKSITARFESYLHDIVREYSMMAEMKGCANIVYCDDVKYIQHDNGMGWDIYIKMELLEALPKMIGKTVTDEQVVEIGTGICNALVFCEKHKLLHRDIKPQNIFVAPDGTYKLGDFGIAKTAERTTSGTKTGTYKYMAPEVYNNQPYGGKADIYSLGLVLYWLLNERRTPFLPLPPATPTSTEEERARERRFAGETIMPPVRGCDKLKKIVLKACAYDPEDRYQSAEEMLQDLGSVFGNSSAAFSVPNLTVTSFENGERTVSGLSTTATECGVGTIGMRGTEKNGSQSSAGMGELGGTVGMHHDRGGQSKTSQSQNTAGQASQVVVQNEKKVFCTQCGAALKYGAKFCDRCGASQNVNGSVHGSSSRQNKKSGKVWIIIGSVAVATALLACLVIGIIHKSTVENSIVTPASRETTTSTSAPTIAPTIAPTTVPTSTPTAAPTAAPTAEPTAAPTPTPDQLTMSVYSGNVDLLTLRPFSTAIATSELNDKDYGLFPASNAIDGSPNTSWQEGVAGLGEGESITLWFNDPTTINVLRIYAGYTIDLQGYEHNGRPRTLRFDFSNNESCTFELSDSFGAKDIALSHAVTTTYVKITIVSAYNAQWQDTAISEVLAYG